MLYLNDYYAPIGKIAIWSSRQVEQIVDAFLIFVN